MSGICSAAAVPHEPPMAPFETLTHAGSVRNHLGRRLLRLPNQLVNGHRVFRALCGVELLRAFGTLGDEEWVDFVDRAR